MELTSGERQVDDVGDGRSKDRSTYLQKPGGDRISVRLVVRTVEENLRYFRFRCKPERLKTGRFSWGRVSVKMKLEALLVREI